METTIKSWADLKEFANSLSEEQLAQPVQVAHQGSSIKDAIVAWSVEEDMINPSGEGLEPVSVYKDEPEILENEGVVLTKDSIVLLVSPS